MRQYNRYTKDIKHAFEKFQESLKKDEISPFVVFSGNEEYLIKWAIDMLIKKYVNPAVKALDLVVRDYDEIDIDNIIEACETFPMMSARKLVIVQNYDNTKVKDLLAYVKSMSDRSILILECEKIDKDLAKEAQVFEFTELKRTQLASFIRKRCKAYGKQIDLPELNYFIDECGYYNKNIDYTIYNIQNDISKIVALNEEEFISKYNINLGIADNLEHGIFVFTDAVCQNKKGESFDLLNQLILSGVAPFSILGALISQLENMYQTKQLMNEGVQLKEITKLLKARHEYPIKKAMGFVRRLEEQDIKKMLIEAYDTDMKIKTGMLDSKMALEMLIASF